MSTSCYFFKSVQISNNYFQTSGIHLLQPLSAKSSYTGRPRTRHSTMASQGRIARHYSYTSPSYVYSTILSLQTGHTEQKGPQKPTEKPSNPKVGSFKMSDITTSRAGRIALIGGFVVLATAESLTYWTVGPKIFGKKSDE